ncbi:uncharacterized protein BXZ73DRAFT_77362 [Epithele typhae]|uniref:uncharacterized protein n=1 Tax=Epithele typhae TaxID=378194 RepID=UPI002008402E|nr:uncharacterized protein BXZ73DRAFT_77362 [Epithele typhae]KAH9933201.1 hypothetical protein BXZ73DRAFT_77362 [Epithele typhae]
MPPSTIPSASDALASLTKAATVALTAVQGVQEQSNAELLHLRSERDDAVKAMHKAQLDAKDLEVREKGLRTALDKSEFTAKHQAETITQLRAEVQQWKTQVARLEDSSQQEIDNWKEQYRRADHERARVALRLEEIVAGQLAWNAAAAHAYTTPYTPRLPYPDLPDIGEPSTSSGTKRASTSHSHRVGTPHTHTRLPVDDGYDSAPAPVRKSRAPPSSRSNAHPVERAHSPPPPLPPLPRGVGTKRKDPSSAGTRGASRKTTAPARAAAAAVAVQPLQIIRRVTAVVDVKREESESDQGIDDGEPASGSEYSSDFDERRSASKRRRVSSVGVKQRRAVRDWDAGVQAAYVEEGPLVEDDEDELLENLMPRRTPGGGGKSRASSGAKQAGPAKKRKLDADGQPSGRAGGSKAAKTR